MEMTSKSAQVPEVCTPEELLIRSIGGRLPIVLLLGQSAWSFGGVPDAVLDLALARLGKTVEAGRGWSQLINNQDLPEDFYVWLSERFGRRPSPEWLSAVARIPWSAVFTSSLDQTLRQAFSSPWREPQAVLTSTEVPVVARSTARPPLYFLFGRAGQSEARAMPPHNRQEMRNRQSVHVVPMLNRLAETVTALGLLVIEGVDLKGDWLTNETLLAAIEQLPKGRILLCGLEDRTSVPDDFLHLIEQGHILVSPSRLPTLIAELEAAGRLADLDKAPITDQMGVVSFRTPKGEVVSYTPSPDLRITVEASAAIIDDSWTSFLEPLGGEAEYAAFRHFHGDTEGPRSIITGIRRDFAILREFEKQLTAKTEDAILNHSRYSDPITVHGQSGTGKSIALARLVARLREARKAPVLYANARIPTSTDVEAFCDETEKQGATATVIVCDNNAPLYRYRDLLSSLQSRGRKVVLVCSTYRQADIAESYPETLIEAPDSLTESEICLLSKLIARFGSTPGTLPPNSDRHILVALYHLLPASRRRLSVGLGNEARSAEETIRSRAAVLVPAQTRSTQLADQLLRAGFNANDSQPLVRFFEDALNSLDDDAGRLITLVMVPGQLGCAVPIDVIIRALNAANRRADFSSIAQMFRGLDLFRWRSGETSEDLLVSPRLTLEAEIICRRRVLDARGEGNCLIELIRATRLGWDAGGTERRFLLDLLQRMGPDGPRGARYRDSFLEIARALTELRVGFGIVDPSLMLQESALRRAAIREELVPQASRLEVLDEARAAVEAAISYVESQRSGGAHRTRANLVVERATIFGYLAIQQVQAGASPDAIWSAYRAARTAANAAVGISETYFPLDVSLWIPADLLMKCSLPEKYRLELVADIQAVLDRIEPSAFPVEQRIKFNKRKFNLGQLLSDAVLTDGAFSALVAEGSKAGYFLRARSLGPSVGADASDSFGATERIQAQAALAFLGENWDAIQDDERCLRYCLQCRWITAVGQRLFRGQRGALPYHEVDRRESLRIVERINSLASLGTDNSLLYLQAVLSWLLNDERFALDAWRDLSRQTDFLDPKRVIRRHLVTDEHGAPSVFSGRIESESDPFALRVDGWNRKIRLLEKDFPGQDLRYGRQISGFAIAFNYIGPIADPVSRKLGGR